MLTTLRPSESVSTCEPAVIHALFSCLSNDVKSELALKLYETDKGSPVFYFRSTFYLVPPPRFPGKMNAGLYVLAAAF